MKLLSFLFLLLGVTIWGQKGFELSGTHNASIPFKLINNLILIPVQVNGVDLMFLLDSGVKETLLFSLENKEVNFNDTEKINFSGLGENKDIQGLISKNNNLSIGDHLRDSAHQIYIILDQSINFSSHIGFPVNGIIGYQFFKDHQVEINYQTKKIIVYRDFFLKELKLKKFTEFPLLIERSKPYMTAEVEMTSTKTPSKMLLDLGNSDALWLFPTLIENFVYNRPNIDDYLGRGFNGDIFGKRSRIHRLYLGNFVFEKPLSALPDAYSIQHLSLVPDRKGSIGNEILRRFTVIFDYPHQRIYLKKNKFYRDPFLFNASGIDIQHDGLAWEKDVVKVETVQKSEASESGEVNNSHFQFKFVLKPKFSVAGCRKDSPCDLAGIKKKDKILSIDNKNSSELTLDKIKNMLKAEDGTRLKIQINRAGTVMDFMLILIDPIPYKDEN